MYLCNSFIRKPPDQSPPNFAQTSTPTQGRFFAQAWPRQPDFRTPGYPKWVTGEKTLCNVKCPVGWRKLIKFFPGSADAQLASKKYFGICGIWPRVEAPSPRLHPPPCFLIFCQYFHSRQVVVGKKLFFEAHLDLFYAWKRSSNETFPNLTLANSNHESEIAKMEMHWKNLDFPTSKCKKSFSFQTVQSLIQHMCFA